MLTWDEVVHTIEDELALPHQYLERSRDELIDYCKRNALRKFNQYIPDKNKMGIDTRDPSVQVSGRKGEYYLFEPDGREIFGVTEFIPDLGSLAMFGHSLMGSMSYEQLPHQALNDERAIATKVHSNFNYMCHFIYPNIIRVTPEYSGVATICYEREHSPDLDTISISYHDLFVELCVGMVMRNIARLRSRYQNLQTPFSEIEFNVDDLKQTGEEKQKDVEEKLEKVSLTSVIVDFG